MIRIIHFRTTKHELSTNLTLKASLENFYLTFVCPLNIIDIKYQ